MEFRFLALTEAAARTLGLPAGRGVPIRREGPRPEGGDSPPLDLPEVVRLIEDYVAHHQDDREYDAFLLRYHHYTGARLANDGRLAEAVIHLERAHALAPGDDVVCADLARSAFELRHFERAEMLFLQLVASGRASLDAHAALARIHMASGRTAEAVAVAEEARRRFPATWESADLLTTIYYHAREIAKLEASLHAQLELDPANVLTLEKLAVYYRECARHSEARTVIERAMRLEPTNVRLRYQSGMIHFAMGRFAEAEEEFRTALRLQEDHLDTLNGLGLLLGERTRPDEAKSILERVLEIAPRDYRGPLNLGRVCLRTGEAGKSEALAWFDKAMDLGMDDRAALKQVYLAAQEFGDTDLAQRADRLLARTSGRAAGKSQAVGREAGSGG